MAGSMEGLREDNARLRARAAAQDSRISDLEDDAERLALLATFANLANARLRAALGAVEWTSDSTMIEMSVMTCPWCLQHQADGHAPDCQRQAALGLAEVE